MKNNELIRVTKLVCYYIKATIIIIKIGICTSNILKYEKKKERLSIQIMKTTGIMTKLHKQGKGNENNKM